MATPHRITVLLKDWQSGDRDALEELIPLVYDHLHRVAVSMMRGERSNHTLQATALVHEAYARLSDSDRVDFESSSHFYSVAALVMRRILIDHARSLGRQRRGGGVEALSLEDELIVAPERAEALLALDDALEALAKVDVRKAKVVELKFFGGLSLEEIAGLLEIGTATVSREWRMARAWLSSSLQGGDGTDSGDTDSGGTDSGRGE